MVTTIQGTTSWTMNASDGPITGYLRVSGGATSFVASTIIGTLGTLDITQTGTYTYTPNRPAFQSLAGGEIVNDQFTISATDGTREVITFDVLGHPDAPTFSGFSKHVPVAEFFGGNHPSVQTYFYSRRVYTEAERGRLGRPQRK